MARNVCDHCGGKFGLARYYYGTRRFCSNKKGKRCKTRYLAARDERLEAEKKKWIAWVAD